VANVVFTSAFWGVPEVTTIVAGGPKLIMKLLLTADAKPVLEAVSVFRPTRLMLRLPNVATPEALVFCVVVPLSVPVPEDKAIRTGTPLCDTLLLNVSCS
jgi:hypothetical protein